MVHLCNIQMLAASTRHRLRSVNYDIDGFVSQLFASRRFVELVDKLSEETANRIKYNFNKKSFIVSSNIDEAPLYNLKGTKRRSNGKKYDIDGFISQVLASKNMHELLAKLTVHAASKIMRTSTNREFRAKSKSSQEKIPKNHQGTNTKIREEPTGKIDLQTIINEMLSLSENLKLKYDYDESAPNTKVQSKESESTESDDNDSISKTGRISKHNKKNDSRKQTIYNKRSRNYAKGHYGKEDPRYSETSHSSHSDSDGEDQENSKKKYYGRTSIHNLAEKTKNYSKKKTIEQKKRSQDYAEGNYGKQDPRYSETSHSGQSGEGQENSKKKYHSQEEKGSGQEHKNSREAQNSELKDKGVKQKTSHTDEKIKLEESVLSLDKEKHKPTPSEKKANREKEETKEEIVIGTLNTDENIVGENVGVQGPEDNVKNNKMVSDDNPYVEVYSKTSERNGHRGEDEKPPVIRHEGGKVYTYVQDTDYDEYNEKMAEWRKIHPEKGMDFMM